jgi:hypothetical protein
MSYSAGWHLVAQFHTLYAVKFGLSEELRQQLTERE